ncbi:MAG: CvpA family protein [Defluviitaleaceae bacterium]|nr:CvpA family protein [Defluviitaleaceae bacterium]
MDISAISGLDVLIVIILVLSIFHGYRRGLIRAVFDLLSNIIALVATYFLSGALASFLRQTPLFTWIQTGIANALGLSDMISENINNVIVQADTIAGLPLPENIRAMLHEHNNPEVHSVLGITMLEDYITGFVATMIINLISAIAVFLTVFAILMLISQGLRVFNYLPVFGKLNRMGGALAGAAIGTFLIWLIFAVMTLLPLTGDYDLTRDTIIAGFFYENNLLLDFFVDISLQL